MVMESVRPINLVGLEVLEGVADLKEAGEELQALPGKVILEEIIAMVTGFLEEAEEELSAPDKQGMELIEEPEEMGVQVAPLR